ncbi:MAG TPA: CHASE3 domain-containing protein [Steroidobacteraceae bacterium]|nr:CHASE3 domain-containing protein [Steroidobacteraceae bacterium]
MTGRRKWWMLAVAGGLACILAIGLVSYSELSSLADSSARVQRSYDVLQTLDDLNGALTDTETNQRGFLLTQDASYLTQYDAAIAQIRLALTELRRLTDGEPSSETAIAHLAQLAGAKLDELQESIHATQAGRRGVALAKVAEGEGKRLMEEFRRDSRELESAQRHLLDERRQQEREARFFSEAVLATTILLSVLLVGAAALVSRRFDERRLLLEREITERRRAEEYREQLLASERVARSDAERATRLKDEFVATLSHELRTPLNAIVGWASILGKDHRPQTVGQGIEVIQRNAKVQAQMIEDLLDMSRILSGKLLIELQRTDLRLVADAAIASVQPTADAKGVRIEVAPGEAILVNGDPGRLQQVIWNLLTNAIKFTPRQGKVDLLVYEANDHANIAVSDTGQGIAADFLPYVFDRFRQGDASTTRRHGGLGLGLSIVKSLVEMHGGSVDAQSPGEGQGTTFIVRLPLANPGAHTAQAATDSPDAGNHALAGLRILIVDDEDDARTLTRRVLEERGAKIVTASSATEALAAAAGTVLHVLVSDIGMPEQDGYELIKKMRALPGDAGCVPAIALTALARGEDRARALHAGYQKHVSKPVDPEELVAVIASLAGRTGSKMD